MQYSEKWRNTTANLLCHVTLHDIVYTEAKVDVTQEIEHRAQWSAPAWAACCHLSLSACYCWGL